MNRRINICSKALLLTLLISLTISGGIYSFPKADMDSTKYNQDSIRTNFSLHMISKDKLDSTKMIESDSLVIGRFAKDISPWINDWQFYVPFDDSIHITLYDKSGNLISDLIKRKLSEGYYSLELYQKYLMPSGQYIILFNSSKNKIAKRVLIIR